ncbi:MAG: MarR family transcriptional regulator [Saprospirales bacterium]|nr:MAG: MarR family transcriptional regulator [Saprospirales bacterium]
MGFELKEKVVSGLERLSEVFRYLYWEKAKVYNLSPIQIQVLLFLRDRPEDFRTVSFLAREFSLTKATLSDSIRVLVSKGLVSKKGSEVDRRSFALELTESGSTMASNLLDFNSPLIEGVSDFSPLELEQFYERITDLIYSLNKSGIIQVQRMCFGCRHYEKKEGGHFCKLMQKPLHTEDIRLDCPEFEKANFD